MISYACIMTVKILNLMSSLSLYKYVDTGEENNSNNFCVLEGRRGISHCQYDRKCGQLCIDILKN